MRKLAIVFILLIMVACAPVESTARPTSTPKAQKSDRTFYRVTRETGWYESLYSGDYSVTVRADQLVVPADNAKTLTCRTVDEYGVKITLCNVEILSSGKEGWVLRNALELDY